MLVNGQRDWCVGGVVRGCADSERAREKERKKEKQNKADRIGGLEAGLKTRYVPTLLDLAR